VSSFSE